MLIITSDNFNEVFNAVVKAYKNSCYNSNCFSSNDVRRKIAASNELERLCKKLESLNVNFKIFMAPIYKKHGIAINENNVNDAITNEFPKSLRLEINCNTLECLFDSSDRYLIVEGCEAPTKEKFFVQLQDDARFAYQQWETSKEAVEELKKVRKFNNIFKVSNKFIQGKNLVSIGIFRDLFSDDNIDCSSILLKYEDKENELLICGAIGGFYKDVAVVDNEKLIDVLPIYGEDNSYHYRTLNKEVKVKIDKNTGCDYVSESTTMGYNYVKKFINHITEYEDRLSNLAD